MLILGSSITSCNKKEGKWKFHRDIISSDLAPTE